MITTAGKMHIKRYLAGIVPAIGGSIAFGLGGGAESINDTTLNFEVDRSDIQLVSYDFINDKLVFKAQVPENYYGKIYEIGLYSKTSTNGTESKMVTTFDSGTETWTTGGVAATFNSTNTRIGLDSLVQTPSVSSSIVSRLTDVSFDFTGNQNSDVFRFAYNLVNGNTSALRFRFMTDGTNYYDFIINSGMTAGYKVTSILKSAATAVGSPNWASINEIQVTTTSGAVGGSSCEFDGIRIDDMTIEDTDYVLVSRELLSAPFTKDPGMVQEVEFTLGISV